MTSSVLGSFNNGPDLHGSEDQPSFQSGSAFFGLIGGLGPPSTVHYYQALLDGHAARGVPARLLIAHADMGHALGLVAAKDRAGLARYLASLIQAMAHAGATFAAVAAVTPHLCMPELRELSPLPLVDIVDVLIHRLHERLITRVALLGTRFTMESRLFGRLEDLDVIELATQDVDEVHRIYLSIASDGRASPADTAYLKSLCRKLHENAGAQAIVIAGTELSLVLREGEESFPLVDCAKAHVEAITERAVVAA
jgi:aspartate racemase